MIRNLHIPLVERGVVLDAVEHHLIRTAFPDQTVVLSDGNGMDHGRASASTSIMTAITAHPELDGWDSSWPLR